MAGGEGDSRAVSLNSLSGISTAEQGQSLQSPSPRTELVNSQIPVQTLNRRFSNRCCARIPVRPRLGSPLLPASNLGASTRA